MTRFGFNALVILVLVLVLVLVVFAAVVHDQMTCKRGHTVSERQAKGTMNHFVCDER